MAEEEVFETVMAEMNSASAGDSAMVIDIGWFYSRFPMISQDKIDGALQQADRRGFLRLLTGAFTVTESGIDYASKI